LFQVTRRLQIQASKTNGVFDDIIRDTKIIKRVQVVLGVWRFLLIKAARGFEFLVRSGTNSFCFTMVINQVVSLRLLCIILRPEPRGRRCLRL
jgi:hypothetical protein